MRKRNAKIAITAAVVLLALGGQARLAHADAIAQSILDITDFTVDVVTGDVTVGIIRNSGTVFAELNGVIDAAVQPATTGGVTLSVCVGPDCPHAPGTEVSPPPTETFASSSAILSGNALTVGADALTDNTVSLDTPGSGAANSNLGLLTTFRIEVAGGPATLTISDNVIVDLLAHIGAGHVGAAEASVNWTLTIVGPTPFVFAPDGEVNAPGETTDECNQNINRATAGVGPLTEEFECSGEWAATITLAPGRYTATIAHSGTAAAAQEIAQIPEPGSLSLAALALLAFGLGRRRFFKS